MSFIRNAWYCAGWSDELTEKPLARTILGEKLALYRTSDGAAAIGNVCPHRYALLSDGKVIGDSLMCPYHGIEFGADGKCSHNPHGAAVSALSVVSHKVVEREKVLWIWMGDAELADPSVIPEMTNHDNPDYTTVYSYLHVEGAYELISDNLLDLSHAQYLHNEFKREDDGKYRQERLVQVDGEMVTVRDNSYNARPFGFIQFAWPDSPERIDSRVSLHWQAPANMMLYVEFAPADAPPHIIQWGAQLVTPETETTSHYFWTQARNYNHTPEYSEAVKGAIQHIFQTEDGWVISQIQENLGSESDLLAMNPVLLKTDNGPIQARRIVKKRIEQEAKALA